jgi:hypothetical protein
MIGAVISCAGILLSAFSPNVIVLILTYGVIGGFGQGLMYVPACVSAGFWFEKKRALATGSFPFSSVTHFVPYYKQELQHAVLELVPLF